MSRRVLPPCFITVSVYTTSAYSQLFLSQYKGSPFHDSQYRRRAKSAYYDLGGEGVAYRDTHSKNQGSGELNPADGFYLNEFRIHEGADASYTKFNRKPDPFDDSPFNKTVPGTQFDPKIVEVFLTIPENHWIELREKLGSPFRLAQLRNIGSVPH